MRIAVIGAGAMGSIYAARLAEAGHDVAAVDTWAAHVAAINSNGLRVEGPDGEILSCRVRAEESLHDVGACDLYIIATKASGVAASALAIAETAPKDAVVLTIQNGLGAGERIAAHLPEPNIMLGVAEGFGASMRGPGHAHHTSMKQIRLGMLAGNSDRRLQDVAELWRSGGFSIRVYEDINQLIWEKLLCNVALSGPCTYFGCNVADLIADPTRWGLALGCMREAYAVGIAENVTFSFDDPEAYVTAFAKRVGSAKPSMLQDHEAKRLSELDAINGAIPQLGKKHAIATPLNDSVCAEIRSREAEFTQAR